MQNRPGATIPARTNKACTVYRQSKHSLSPKVSHIKNGSCLESYWGGWLCGVRDGPQGLKCLAAAITYCWCDKLRIGSYLLNTWHRSLFIPSTVALGLSSAVGQWVKMSETEHKRQQEKTDACCYCYHRSCSNTGACRDLEQVCVRCAPRHYSRK